MNHYVYIITNLMNGKKYIGKRSCKCKIEDDKYMGSGIALNRSKNKYGIEWFEKKILMVCKTEDEAYENEKKAIELVRAWENPMYYNLDGGGRGVGSGESNPSYGKILTEEEKAIISKRRKGKNIGEKNPRYGIGAGRGKSHPSYGKKRTQETKLKMRKSKIGLNNPRSKSVICLNTREVFETIKCAGDWCGLKNHGGISLVCNYKQNFAGKHPITKEPLKWMYLEDYENSDKDIYYLLNKRKDTIKKDNPSCKMVVCLNDKTVFNSIKEASEWCGLKYNRNIGKSCRGKLKSAGKHPETGEKLRWMYLEGYENKYGKINKEIS